ncbi:MAG: FecR family protein [Novosphingobium pentaromativorans]|uniref:FecR family protein n=1 Tax=Novosphingobium pentaromativorans TaxID=205844 RepID=A0A2W5NLK9_9SPHN|nr:MAG: FecR family protein [Novosphingobium pentaromativorans]
MRRRGAPHGKGTALVMADSPIPKEIADEAARRFADRDSGLLDDETELNAWLDADPRHAQAFAEMEVVWSDLGGVTVPPALRASLAPPRLPSTSVHPRRGLPRRWVPTALAASLALVVVVGAANDWPTRWQADAMTAPGEQRMIAMPDGSHILLNTRSAVAFDYAPGRRTVRLLKGEAAFTVAPDRRRPFTVEAGGGSTTALGTRFLVRTLDDGAQVSVTEHRVRVAVPAAQGRTAEVGEGQSIRYSRAQGFNSLETGKVADADAWTQGFLTFEDRPLSEVVAELGRYHSGYLQVIGEDVRARRVSGVFNIHDPVGAIAKLQASLGLRSTRLTDRLIFIYS